MVSEFELHKTEGTSVKPLSFQSGSIPRKHTIVTTVDKKALNQFVSKVVCQDNFDRSPMLNENTGQQVDLHAEAESLVQRVIEEAKEQSKAREIVQWLAEQDLLSKDSLRLVDPKTECPSHWPLGWKNTLQIVINKLRQEAP